MNKEERLTMDESEENKKEINLTRRRYILSLFIALIIGAAGMYGVDYFLAEEPDPIDEISLQEDFALDGQLLLPNAEEFSSLNKMYMILKNSYFEELDSEILIDGALEGMSRAIGDPYTEYLNEEQAISLEEDISGSFQGIGAEVMKEGEYVRIISPIANSPAEEAGLRPNDLVIEVAGESVAELSITEAVALIRGPEGSEVELLIKRGTEEFSLTLTRANIPVETVFYEQDEKDSTIGYVNIVNFNLPTYDETVEAIQDLEVKGVEKIIFDVRGNPGGLLTTALQVSNIFVPDGERMMLTEYREDDEPTEFIASEEYGDFKYEGEAVLLVDEGSASASEILAGAMQSVDIPIYGQATFGKGTIQSVVDISEKEEIKFTVGKWLTANGDWINEDGIQPDQKVELPAYARLFVVNTSDSFKEGEASPEVKNLKEVMKALGYKTTDNNVFDQSVIEAIQSFQKDKNLSADGKVTVETAREITDALRDKIEENDSQYEAAVKAFN